MTQKIKKEGVIDVAADFPPPNAKVDDAPNVIGIFGDLFENKTMTKEDEHFLNDLLIKTVDAKQLQIIPVLKYTPVKNKELNKKN